MDGCHRSWRGDTTVGRSAASAAALALALVAGSGEAAAVPPPVLRSAAVSPAVHHDLSRPLRSLPPAPASAARVYPARPLPVRTSPSAGPKGPVQTRRASALAP